MNLQDMLSKPIFPRLHPGVHQVVILSWKVKASSTGEDFVSIEFAPANELRHIHTVSLFASEQVNTLATFTNNIQDILNLPGATTRELLDACLGLEVPATYEVNVQPERTYHNWYLGWAKPAPPTPVAPAPVADAPARRPRA